MNKDEKLYQELRSIEGELEKIKKQRWVVLEDKETQSLIIKYLVAEKLLDVNDPSLKSLWDQIAEKKAIIKSRETELKGKIRNLSDELRALTRPLIERSIERLRGEGNVKPISELVDKMRGFDGSRIVISTNQDGILKIQRMIEDGIEKLKSMELMFISEIQNFTDETLEKIHSVDLSLKERTMSEVDFNRQQFMAKAIG